MWIGLTVDADRKWTWDDGTEVTYAGWHTGTFICLNQQPVFAKC